MFRFVLIIAIACFATTCHANAYDHRDRVVQTVAMNHLGGIDRKSTAYDFAGRPIGSTLEHSTATMADSTVVQRWRHSFDRHGRELTASLRFGAGQWQAISGKEYDAVGRIGSETIGEPDRHICRTYIYDIRSNPVSVSSYGYRQKLSFTPAGNISRMTWGAYGPNETERTYEFGYDALARLTSARYSDTNGKRGLFDTSYSYDLNGNITALRRSGLYDTSYYGDRYGLIDDLTYSYSGNQVTAIADACAGPFYYGAYHFADGADLDVEYTYDANGNMTADLNRGITAMAYDLNNRPSAIEFSSGASVSYIYDADGRKLRTVRAIPSTPPAVAMEGGTGGEAETTVTDYCGDYIYEEGMLERINTPAGYLSFRDNHGDRLDSPRHIFFLRDHLGNNRVAVDGSNGAILQINHYYPFGMPMNAGYNTGFQPWKFGGKEFDRTAGLDLYDFEARAYDPSTARFIRHDDLTEKYLPLSPYTYCANNPLRLIDPTGKIIETVWDIGNIIYDLGAAIYNQCTGNQDAAKDNLIDAGLDTAAALIPGVPAGASKVAKTTTQTVKSTIKGVENSKNAVKTTQTGNKIGNSVIKSEKSTEKISFIQGHGKNAVTKNIEVPKGYRLTKLKSNGEKVYTNGKNYITPDNTGHNGGVWKMAKKPKDLNNRNARLGTYDENLKRIGN